jgi:hypothetical protein
MPVQHLLDLAGKDVLAADDQHLLDSTGDREEALGVDPPDVAPCLKKPALVERPRRSAPWAACSSPS